MRAKLVFGAALCIAAMSATAQAAPTCGSSSLKPEDPQAPVPGVATVYVGSDGQSGGYAGEQRPDGSYIQVDANPATGVAVHGYSASLDGSIGAGVGPDGSTSTCGV